MAKSISGISFAKPQSNGAFSEKLYPEKSRRERPAAVLFDMDGVLIDSEGIALQAVAHAANVVGHLIPDTVAHQLIGRGRDGGSLVLVTALGGTFPVVRFWDVWHADYRERVAAGVPLKPGALGALQALSDAGIRAAVATSTETALARYKLEQAGLLAHIEVVVGRDAVTHGKPAPDLYLHAARELGVDPRQCWAFEDSLPGLTAAVAAGARTHWVPDLAHIHSHELPSGVETIDSLHAICRWL